MEYKISDLIAKTGVTKRTVHYYIAKGLLMPPSGSGVNSLYGDEHVNRILLIKKLQEQYLPLSKIREYILENPQGDLNINPKSEEKPVCSYSGKNIYVKEDICGIFELQTSLENAEKYKHIIENVKKYVEKMMEN